MLSKTRNSGSHLELPFDLSKYVLTTANSVDTVPQTAGQMEVINISGYTEEEKLHIAADYQYPNRLKTFTEGRKRHHFRGYYKSSY